MANSQDLDPIFEAAGQQYGIDPALLKAHAYVESGFNTKAVSPQNAQGIMQMLPATARSMGAANPFDPAQAIPAAAKYLAEGFDRFGNGADAARYYHGGPDVRGWGPKTNAYAEKVAQAYQQFSQQGGGKQAATAQPATSTGANVNDLVAKYGTAPGAQSSSSQSQPQTSGGSDQPASEALTIKVKAVPQGANVDDLIAKYGAPSAGTDQAVAQPVQPGDESAAVGRAIIDGVPVVGPYLTTLTNMGIAGARSLSSGKPFAEEYKTAKEFGQATADANPLATTAGNVLGGVAGLMPVAATGVGAAALGMRGPLAARIAAGAASGGGLGAADASVRGQDPVSAGTVGAMIGSGVPLVGRAIGAALGPVYNKLTAAVADRFDPVARSSNRLMEMVGEAGQTIPGLRAEIQRNPNLALADLNPSLQSSVASLAQAGGPEAAAARQFASARRGAGGDMLRADFDNAIGAAPDPVALKQGMMDTAKANAAKGFGDALGNAKPVDLNGLPDSSVKAISEAWDRAVAKFPDPSQLRFTQPEALHLVQQELRRNANVLANSSSGVDKLAAGDLNNVRQQLIRRIDDASGGKYRPAQKQYADDLSVGEAFDNGMSSLNRVRNGAKGLEDMPQALRQEWQGMSQPEREAYRQGMRTQLASTMDAARNAARAGEAITDPGFNREKLGIVFGDKEANRLLQAVEDSRKIASTNNLIDSGSKSGQVLLGQKSVGLESEKAAGGTIDNALTALAIATGDPLTITGRLGTQGARMGLISRKTAADAGRNKLLNQAGLASGPQAEATLNKLETFLAARQRGPVAARRAIESNAPLNLLIRAGGQRSLAVPQ